LPLNPVIIVSYCSDKAPDHGPYLTGPRGLVRLKPLALAGLGPLLRAFTPTKNLEPNQRYELNFRGERPDRRDQPAWVAGESVDTAPPSWGAPPFVEYAASSRDVRASSEVFLGIAASEDSGALAVLLELDADPATVGAPLPTQFLLRGVAAPAETTNTTLALESGYCSSLHFRSGAVFEARLSLMDAAGNLTPSPAAPLRFRIPELRPYASYEVRTVVPRHPAVLFKSEPPFPAMARKALVQGVVKGELAIDPKGHVEVVTIVEGRPAGLTDATIEALQKWRFAPARNGAVSRKVPFSTHFTVIHPSTIPIGVRSEQPLVDGAQSRSRACKPWRSRPSASRARSPQLLRGTAVANRASGIRKGKVLPAPVAGAETARSRRRRQAGLPVELPIREVPQLPRIDRLLPRHAGGPPAG
jgi:TonB family protein